MHFFVDWSLRNQISRLGFSHLTEEDRQNRTERQSHRHLLAGRPWRQSGFGSLVKILGRRLRSSATKKFEPLIHKAKAPEKQGNMSNLLLPSLSASALLIMSVISDSAQSCPNSSRRFSRDMNPMKEFWCARAMRDLFFNLMSQKRQNIHLFVILTTIIRIQTIECCGNSFLFNVSMCLQGRSEEFRVHDVPILVDILCNMVDINWNGSAKLLGTKGKLTDDKPWTEQNSQYFQKPLARAHQKSPIRAGLLWIRRMTRRHSWLCRTSEKLFSILQFRPFVSCEQ